MLNLAFEIGLWQESDRWVIPSLWDGSRPGDKQRAEWLYDPQSGVVLILGPARNRSLLLAPNRSHNLCLVGMLW